MVSPGYLRLDYPQGMAPVNGRSQRDRASLANPVSLPAVAPANHSSSFDPVARTRVKRDADELMEKFADYFAAPVAPPRDPAGYAAAAGSGFRWPTLGSTSFISSPIEVRQASGLSA